MVDLKSYFHDRYKGGQDFVENVIKPIFGEDRYDDAYEEDVLEDNPELLKMADATGISQIIRMGTIDIPMNPTDVYDITVSSRVQMERNRVKIQSLVRGIMSTYSSAFMVFHYEDDTRWDWRFTFCSKFGSNKEATDSKRYTFLLGPNQSCRTAADNFSKLAQKHGDIELDDIVDAFDVEALSKEFFAKYKAHYEKFCQFVYDNKDNRDYFGQEFSLWEDKIIRDYVKKLLGRIVFLHFLQKKGWLGVPAGKPWGDGDTQFMKHLFEASSEAQKDSYLDMVLEPLFADALNTQRENDVFNLHVEGFTDTKIPYLNGGLFERDELDAPKSVFPAAYFESLFEFLSQYNFTIDENDPNDAEMGIDPEMLGRIFENLLEDNKDKGAFYTPKEIVQYMCRESLIAYLTTCVMKRQGEDHQPEDKIRDAVRELLKTPETIVPKMSEKHLEDFGTYIRMVKICDPAIGSGAFPMGLLNELVRCRASIGAWATDAQGVVLTGDYAALKAEIICNNIYGVDIEKGAVDIARLRFWLSIIVDEQSPHALPNFDYKFMQGNSLIPTFDGQYVNLDTDGQQHVNVDKMKKEKRRLYNLKREHYGATGLRKYQLSVEIKDCILQLISLQLGYELRHWFQQNVVQTSLFPDDEPKQLSFADIMPALPPERQRICDLGAALRAKLNDATIPIEERAQTDIRFFDWRMMFTEVFEGENPGFDIVIGNPPYLRIQGIRETNPKFADYLSTHYLSATGSFDLYVTFAEKGMNLINTSGIVNFIMPTKWTNSAFGKGLRRLVSKLKSASKIINFGAYQVFNASTYTGLQWFTPNSQFLKYVELDRDLSSNEELKQYLDSLNDKQMTIINQEELSEIQWVLTNNKVAEVLNRLYQHPRRIKDVFDKIFQGLATSKDDVYFIYDCRVDDDYIIGESKQLGRIVQIEKGLVKPLLKGDDVHRYDTIKTDRYVIFPYKIQNGKALLYTESELEELYPKGFEYLKECENVLREREKGRFNIDGEWFQFGRKQGILYAEKEKLVAPDISMGGNFAYDCQGEFYQTTTIYGYIKKQNVQESYKFWMALLNSRLFWWYLVNTGTVLANGFFRFKPDYVNPFPVPQTISKKAEQSITILVDYILTIKSLPNDFVVDEYVDKDTIIRQFERVIDALIYELYFPNEFMQANISFADIVPSTFAPVKSNDINEAVITINKSFELLSDMNNEIRNNLKYMSVKLETLLAPIINV